MKREIIIGFPIINHVRFGYFRKGFIFTELADLAKFRENKNLAK